MLSLLSKYVVGETPYESDVGSSQYTDTDEEVLAPAMPVINIDPTELGQDALTAEQPSPTCLSPVSDSSEEPTEKEEAPLELPEPEVCRRVLELVEYYLSEHNLVKDMFMLKHVTKHREGYVSLKLLATYKKVKHLTKDWRVVAHALKDSEALELNPEGTKVRRRHALPPELDEDTRPFRTLLAADVSRELANVNALAEFFGKFGEMVSLQMHKPGGRHLAEVRQVEREHPGISGTVCALVEFEKVHHARQAFRTVLNDPECGLRVVEVARKKRDPGGGGYGSSFLHIKNQTEGESAYYSNSDYSEPPSPVSRVRPFPRIRSPFSPSPSPKTGRRIRGHQQQSSPESSPPSPYSPRRGAPTPSSSPEQERSQDLYPRYTSPCTSPLPRRRATPFSPPPDSPFLGRRHITTSPCASQDSDAAVPPLSPWLRRRVLSGSSTPLASPLASPNLRRRHEASMMLPDNVTRLPRGPDGSRGFLPRRSPLILKA
uniref:Uncharacterized protein n=1 Tax=Scylla olivacea TaxID=85551 RepID=A0A0P4WEY8_SCYOL